MGFGVTHWLDLSVESWSFEVSGTLSVYLDVFAIVGITMAYHFYDMIWWNLDKYFKFNERPTWRITSREPRADSRKAYTSS